MRALKVTHVLNRNVQNPPTEKELMVQAARWNRWIQFLGALVAVLVLAVMVEFIFNGGYGLSFTIAAGEMVAIAIFGITFPIEPVDATPLPKSLCNYAYEQFSATPEGMRYLERIREQGREVTLFDVEAAKAWANQVRWVKELSAKKEQALARQAENEQACKKLYGIEA